MDKKNIADNSSQKPNVNWKSLLWTIALLLILNSLVFPYLFKPKIIPTTYSAFISKVDSGLVKQVNIDGNKVYFTTPNGEVDRKGNPIDAIFQTGRMSDANLVDRLLEAESPNENGKIEFSETIPRENSPILNFLLFWVLPGAIFFFIWRNAMRSMRGKLGGNYMSFGQNKEKIYAEDEIKTTFADVAGQEEAKESLNEIVDFLHNPKKYTEIGATLPKGVLLVGPPGTGKTLIARAVAGETKVPFFALSGSEFVQMFVGMGAAKVRDLFSQANKKAPCIIFIDEIDAIGKRRDGITTNDEREQTLNQLLTEMDGFNGQKGVVILAATNRPESLDKALLRPGRFDRRVQMELPDLEGRKAILQVHLKKIQHDEIDLDLIARATSGASGAELANIVNEAALRAVRNNRNSVITNDLEESIETVIAGAKRKGKVISDEEKRIIAYHEIGHALVAAMQTHSAPVHKITIIPRTSGALGYTMQIDESERNLFSKEDLENRIATLTGGRAAEEVIFNKITTGASNDIEQATKLARAMVTRYGMSEEFDMVALETINNPYLSSDTSLSCSPETAARIDDVVLSIVKKAHEKAKKIIRENENKMHELSEYLIKKETITGEEFMNILKNKTT
ncbi:MAG: ATP-dependent zinc metalloprotease FtsH [Bacteroidales bacterium]|jgi:cell division protease FtsH|nr:ATP-dependent zinc metalloprotease FtsH [Bacteroidales bacterium]MDI9593106.1 ATP-dependent zinc metalloprotease FtsH [Bacteroidota bacterium]HOF81258.1 ATP-dependent zinc metalloprotease FtsH [Bacteroidales bacterium]